MTRRIIFWVALFFTAIVVLDSFAPHDYARPVPVSVITPGAVTGSACPIGMTPTSAVAVNDAGPSVIYKVTCQQPNGYPLIVTGAR